MTTIWGICSVLFVVIIITNAQSSCKTPDNQNGKCIALEQCRSLHSLLRGELSTEQRTSLQKSHCGQRGSTHFVCCPTFRDDDLPAKNSCGVQAVDKIVGGHIASIGEFPWMALLRYRTPDGREDFSCGGALIHENYVITAAHCIEGWAIHRKNLTLISVRLGEHDLRSDPDCQENECSDLVEDIPVAGWTVHEGYSSTFGPHEHDIAVIRLQSAAPYTDYIRPICLPILNLQNKDYDGKALMVAGFGRTENASRSDVKLKLELNGFNLEQCAAIYQRASTIIGTNVLCAGGEQGDDSCSGDSGGPLVATEKGEGFYYLVGVVSFGTRKCGTPGFPGVYTRIDKYRNWILDNMTK